MCFLGIMQAIQNLGLAVISLLAGYIVDRYGYLWLEIFFIGWLILAAVSTIFIFLADLWKDGYLNMSAKQRAQFDKSKAIVDDIFG